MDITYAIIFVAIVSGAFYLLIRDDLVRSRGALCSVWLCLGVSLMVWALTLLATGAAGTAGRALSSESVQVTVRCWIAGTAFAYLLLGIACMCLPLSVYPMYELQAGLTAGPRSRRRHPHHAAPDRAAPEAAEAFEQFATSLDDPPADAKPTS